MIARYKYRVRLDGNGVYWVERNDPTMLSWIPLTQWYTFMDADMEARRLIQIDSDAEKQRQQSLTTKEVYYY